MLKRKASWKRMFSLTISLRPSPTVIQAVVILSVDLRACPTIATTAATSTSTRSWGFYTNFFLGFGFYGPRVLFSYL
ncbi:hypothetical protein RchiOBHm_Chr1g0338921 [Rosa chinensis]|uniref:Uncharacterized protein n=1 Tax=Rosa chinensis TaxID=74649 RepID=A0A2P6SD41_ROSCH|nr:hypothetical protein RchiOBHm_Chr1g0338921 [Rosa chinensis]